MAHQVFFQLGNFSRQSQRPSKALYFCSMFLSINKLFIIYYFILLEIYTFKLFRSTKSSVYISTFTVVFSWRFRRKFTTLTVASFFFRQFNVVGPLWLFIQTFSVQTFRSFRLSEGERRVRVSH